MSGRQRIKQSLRRIKCRVTEELSSLIGSFQENWRSIGDTRLDVRRRWQGQMLVWPRSIFAHSL